MPCSTSARLFIPFAASTSRSSSSIQPLYSRACSAVSGTSAMFSSFSGRSSRMPGSVFMRRRMNGAVICRSSAARSTLPSRSMGAANRDRNDRADPSMLRLQKSMIARSSFSTGVPVSAIRCRAGSDRTARDAAVFGFFTACASSRIT